MNIRRIVVVAGIVLATMLSATPLFAQSSRLGLAAGIPNGVLVYRPAPFDFRFGYDFTPGQQFVFVSGDWRFIDNQPIVGVLHFSVGVGGYGKFFPRGRRDNDTFNVDWGVRVPAGLSVLLLDNFLELFLEFAPSIDLYPRTQFSNNPVQFFGGFTFEIG